ncbi:MAG TPA: ACP S-malonyltransferase [Bacilli bacterium]
MGKIAFVFPGQGAQAVGMGKDAYETAERAKAIYDQADDLLGFKLSELIFNGPEDKLKLTYYTQPALLTTSYVYFELFKSKGIQPDFVAGHSLGEYSALVAAGALPFAAAVKTVHARGLFMDQAVPAGQGAMAAMLGADRDLLRDLCANVSRVTAAVEMANINCPGQIVVSGTKEGVAAVIARAGEAGAKRAIPLEVSGPFHSSLMQPAAEKLSAELAAVPFSDAKVPVVANVTALPETAADRIRELLVKQVVSPVLWEDSVKWMIAQGVDTFYEIGSGTVLSGLIKKVDRSVKTIAINSVAAIAQTHANV